MEKMIKSHLGLELRLRPPGEIFKLEEPAEERWQGMGGLIIMSLNDEAIDFLSAREKYVHLDSISSQKERMLAICDRARFILGPTYVGVTVEDFVIKAGHYTTFGCYPY